MSHNIWDIYQITAYAPCFLQGSRRAGEPRANCFEPTSCPAACTCDAALADPATCLRYTTVHCNFGRNAHI